MRRPADKRQEPELEPGQVGALQGNRKRARRRLELRRSKLARQEDCCQRPEAEGRGREAAQSGRDSSGQQEAAESNVCAACQRPIRERYLLAALGKRWHEDCLKCACCECRLGEVGSSLFQHSDKLLCRRDFLRIFGQQGRCAACRKSIPAYELVMRAGRHAYHLDCFNCQLCRYRFCVGDHFRLGQQRRVLCLLCHQAGGHAQALPREAVAEAGPAELI